MSVNEREVAKMNIFRFSPIVSKMDINKNDFIRGSTQVELFGDSIIFSKKSMKTF